MIAPAYMTTIDVLQRTVVNGVGYCNIFSPTTKSNPNGWLVLRQYSRGGIWYPSACFHLSTTYSALRWYLLMKEAIASRDAGHDGVRLVYADGSVVAEYVKFSTKKGPRPNGQ